MNTDQNDYIDIFGPDGFYSKSGSDIHTALDFLFACHIKGNSHAPTVYADIANASIEQIEDLLQVSTALDRLYASSIIADVIHHAACVQDLSQETVVAVCEVLFHDLCNTNSRTFYRKHVCEAFTTLVHLSFPRQILKQISKLKIDEMHPDTDEIFADLIVEAALSPSSIAPKVVKSTLEMLRDTDSPLSFAALAATMKEVDNVKHFKEFLALSWHGGLFSAPTCGLKNIREIKKLGKDKLLTALAQSEVERNSHYLCTETTSESIINLVRVVGEKTVFDARLTQDIGSSRFIHSFIDYVIMSDNGEYFNHLIDAWSEVFSEFLMNIGSDYLDRKHLQKLREIGKAEQALEGIKRAEKLCDELDREDLVAIAAELGFQALKEIRPSLHPRVALEIFEDIDSESNERNLKREFLKAFPEARKLTLSSDLGL